MPRLKQLTLSEEWFSRVLTSNGLYRVYLGLPQHCRLWHVEHNRLNRTVTLIFEHSSFPEVGEGCQPSVLTLEEAWL